MTHTEHCGHCGHPVESVCDCESPDVCTCHYAPKGWKPVPAAEYDALMALLFRVDEAYWSLRIAKDGVDG